jgi:hypothetical protein
LLSICGRAPVYTEKALAQFPAGTPARIAAVLKQDEDRATFFRTAVAREIKRRATSCEADRRSQRPAKAP